jgi:hypothetical protein
MANLTESIELTAYEGVQIIDSKTEPGKHGIFIPIEDNGLVIGKTGKVYQTLSVWEKQSPDKFGYTHGIKFAYSKEYAEKHGGYDALKSKPFVGNAKPIVKGGFMHQQPIQTTHGAYAQQPPQGYTQPQPQQTTQIPGEPLPF